MKKTMMRLTFAATLALSLLASTSGALASDAKVGRETAWTDLGDLPPIGVTWELDPIGVTWELDPVGLAWDE